MKNLIWKECIIGLRTVGILIVMVPIIQFVPTLFLSKEYLATIKDVQVLNNVLANVIMYFPAMQIPMIGTILFQAVINEERKQKILSVLFANGISPENIWRSKIFSASLIAYILSLSGTFIGIIYSRLVYNIWISMNFWAITQLLVIFPLISLVFLNIICLIMWICKNAQFFVGFIPAVSYLGCMYMNLFQINIIFNYIILGFIIMFVTVIFIYVCGMIAGKVDKEHLVEMEV